MATDYECETQCVKVEQLRKDYDKTMTLEKWCEDEDNVLCCRRGRVFIGSGKDKHVFAYPESKWHNPYKSPKDGTLEQVCAKFEGHILTSDLANDLEELVGKTLGCFCLPTEQCHTRVLQRLVSQRHNLPPVPEIPVEDEEVVEIKVKLVEGKCVAITKSGVQCQYKKKNGDYCGIHTPK